MCRRDAREGREKRHHPRRFDYFKQLARDGAYRSVSNHHSYPIVGSRETGGREEGEWHAYKTAKNQAEVDDGRVVEIGHRCVVVFSRGVSADGSKTRGRLSPLRI